MCSDRTRVEELERELAQVRAELDQLRKLEQKKESDLLDSELRYQRFIEHAPFGVFVADRDGNYLDVNAEAAKITGYTQKELLRMKIADILPPEGTEAGIQHFKRLRTDSYSTGEVPYLHKSGETRFWRISAVRISDNLFMGFTEDITESKKFKDRVHESEDRFQRMLAVIPDMISIHDREMNILYSNWQGFAAVPEEKRILNTKCFRTYRGYDDLCPDCQAGMVLENGIAFQREVELPENQWVDLRVIPLMDENGQINMFMEWVRDITERKQQEKQIEVLARMLDDAPAAITIHDHEGNFLFSNSRTPQMHGYDNWEEFLKINLHQLDVPESEKMLAERFRKIDQEGEANFDVAHFRKDGSTFPLHVLAKKIEWDGKPAVLSVAADISELKEAEEALHESEERYHLLSDLTMEGILLHKNGKVIDMNNALEKMIGGNFKEFQTSNPFQFVHPDDLPLVMQNMALDQAKPYIVRIQRLDGTFFHAEVEGRNFRRGDDLWRVSAVRDITTRLQAEQALRESEKLFRTLYMNLPGGMVLIDREYRIVNVNQRVCEITGYTRDELVGQLCDIICPKGSASKQCPIWAEEQHGFEGMDTNVKCKDGSFNPILKNARRVWIRGKEHILEVFQDIREQKETEKALRESEFRYKSLHNASFGGIAIHDQGKILECNLGLSEMTGYTIDELIDSNGLLLIAEESRPFVMEKIRTGYEKPYEAIGLRKDGSTYPLQIEARNIPYKGKIVRTTEFRDCTAQKEAEKEKERLEIQLHQSQKMESVGRLAGGVAHDFNNMLGVIIGYSELLLDTMPDYNDSIPFLREIKKAASRSADLTQQLLAFARKQTVSPKILDLNMTIESMLKMLGRLIGENISLSWKPGTSLSPIRIDPIQIDQILANLVVNARDAIGPDGGAITIETEQVLIDQEYCEHHAGFCAGMYVVLSVSDSGKGIDKETQKSIFEPFFTTKGIGEGTGLGLATVYGIVRQNDGFINLYSEPGLGSSFRIYLPVFDQEKVTAVTGTNARISLPHGKETLLLVEDEPAMLTMTRTILAQLGYTVLTASSPQEALDLTCNYPGKIDLLLTDVVMPQMNGKQLAVQLREILPDLKCLYMSGYTASIIAHHGVLEDGARFLQKPFKPQQLAVSVREALDGK